MPVRRTLIRARQSCGPEGPTYKNYPFSAGNAQNGGGLGEKSGIFVFFGVVLGFRPLNSAKLFLGQPHYSALRKTKSAIFFPAANGSKPPPNHIFISGALRPAHDCRARIKVLRPGIVQQPLGGSRKPLRLLGKICGPPEGGSDAGHQSGGGLMRNARWGYDTGHQTGGP